MKRLMAGLVCRADADTDDDGGCAQEYQNVSQLRESAPARWTTTIETKWRGVAIDAKIVTPNVEAIPVVKVGYDLHPSPLTPEESGWTIVDDSYRNGGHAAFIRMTIWANRRAKLRGGRLAAWPCPKAHGMTLANRIRAYIPMCDVTYSEMMDMISTEMARFGYPVEDFDLETPAELRLFQWCFAGTKEDAAPGYFHMSFYPKVKGVTVYGHILDAVHNTRGESRRKDGFWEKMRSQRML